MSWLFVLIVFGTGGVAFEHHPTTSQAKCVGLEATVESAWLTGQHHVEGLGEIKGFDTVCTRIPDGIETEQFATHHPRYRPQTVYRPTAGPFPIP